MIRCVLADDQTLFREVLTQVLDSSSSIRIIEDYPDAREAAERAITTQADVLILDINIPGPSPFLAAQWAKQQSPRLKVIFLTGSTLSEHLLRAKHAGANGYVNKTCNVDELIDALVTVARGGSSFTSLGYDDGIPHTEKLSPRQLEVLKLLAEGNTVKETAVLLDLSAKTVEVHKSHIMSRLGLHTNVELTRYAIKNQVVSLE